MILPVVFLPDDQEQESALHFDPTICALMPALMLTNQLARRVPGVAKAATEDLKKLTVTNNHFGRPFQWWEWSAPSVDHGGRL